MQKMGIWRDYLIEVLADRDEAIGYLQAILDDYYIYRSLAVVLRALETVVEAQGGVSELAKRADMEPQAFSEMLSNKETPLIDALGTVLKALGCQLSIAPLQNENLNLNTNIRQTHVAEHPPAPQ